MVVCRWDKGSILLLCIKWLKLPRGSSCDTGYKVEQQERCQRGSFSPGLELDGDKKANFIGREGTNWEKELAILEGFGNL